MLTKPNRKMPVNFVIIVIQELLTKDQILMQERMKRSKIPSILK
jgi:hypothetical protein